MAEEKLQISVYRINNESDLFPEDGNHFSSIVEHIKTKGFNNQNINNSNSDYQIELFYKKNPLNPKWKDFLSMVVEDKQDILKKDQSWAESFVMILLKNSTNNLYVVVGGLLGYHAIEDFIDDDFGVDILSRLITKEDKILKYVKEKSVMGGILGTTKFFRKNYNFFENDSFGKIYQELKTSLNKDMLQNQFGFSLDDIKEESTCIAKSSFRINKSINLDQLFQVISGCEYVLENPNNDSNLKPISINNVEKIVKKRNLELVENLEDELLDQLWRKYNEEEGSLGFDLCHKEFEQYLTASKYVVKKNLSENNLFGDFEFKELNDIYDLFKQIKKTENTPTNKNDFIELMRVLKIYSYGEENQRYPLTKGWVLNHIFGDVSLKEQKYFLIDNVWYRIKDSFIKELNESCQSFFKNNYCGKLDKQWNHPQEGEDQYIQKYIAANSKNDRTIILHKITPDYVEPCDVLLWDDVNAYLFHIKAGFTNNMRDLCSQIFIAANKIKQDLNSSKDYIAKIYDQVQSKKISENDYLKSIGAQTDNITKEEFIEILSSKKLIFVLSVLDVGANQRDLKINMSDFNSSIAKFSLQELVKGMKGIDMEFMVSQIAKQ